ncbi:MAG: hypothetical protein GEU75_17330 [Dehalococcoidia bacterium]|nr:hypothetical protein [Dehalococcoidia bacterium]
MFDRWETKRALIVVKTYPTPAWKGGEVVCTAAITEEGQWLRLFPIPYRLLGTESQFEKYQWIEAKVTKASSDARPESYNVDMDSIKLLQPRLTTAMNWQSRKAIVIPLLAPSMCWLREQNIANNRPTLGLVKPSVIKRLRIEPTKADWSPAEMARLNQLRLIDSTHVQLEKVPYTFFYDFDCSTPDCPGHKMSCTDWEMTQAFRSWTEKYGDGWEVQFRNRFDSEMREKFDTHFYVGTVHGNPHNWVIVGLFYPPKTAGEQLNLL